MNVLLTLEAIYDIADISVYIEAAFGPERALQFEVDIEAQFEKLDRYTHSDTGIRYNDHIIYRDVFCRPSSFLSLSTTKSTFSAFCARNRIG